MECPPEEKLMKILDAMEKVSQYSNQNFTSCRHIPLSRMFSELNIL